MTILLECFMNVINKGGMEVVVIFLGREIIKVFFIFYGSFFLELLRF